MRDSHAVHSVSGHFFALLEGPLLHFEQTSARKSKIQFPGLDNEQPSRAGAGNSDVDVPIWDLDLGEPCTPKHPRITPPETNSIAPGNGWLEHARFLLGWLNFRGYVGFRECKLVVLGWMMDPKSLPWKNG